MVSACVYHAPSGIAIAVQIERSHLLNKEHALRTLRSRLYQIELDKRHAERDKVEATKKRIDFGSQIRNYVLHPYKLIKDLRTGLERTDVQNVPDGDLDESEWLLCGVGVSHWLMACS